MVKTTFELPRSLLARVKAYAAMRNVPMKTVVEEALEDRVASTRGAILPEPGWKRLFGAFRENQDDTSKIQKIIDEEFSKIDPEDWK